MAELTLLLCYATGFVLLWTPCSLLAQRLWGQRAAAPSMSKDILALVFAAAASYLAFWIYLVSPRLGQAVSTLVLGGGVSWVGLGLWQRRVSLAGLFSIPVRLTFLIGLLYLSGVSLYGGVERVPSNFVHEVGEDPAASYFWLRPRSIDSLIPVKFARAVAADDPLRGREIGFGMWRFSDRPPLQAGSLLLLWPLTRIFGCGIVNLAVGVLLQVQWVLAVFALSWTFGRSRRRAVFIVLMLAVTGFVYFSSVFVWPKFLAAALWMVAMVPLVRVWLERRAPQLGETVVAAAGSVLALLAHGSIGFSLLPTAAVALLYRPFRSWRFWLPGAAVALALYLPWAGYLRLVDPPGNRCMRLLFAGDHEPGDRPSFSTTIEAYRQRTWSNLVEARTKNLLYLFSDPLLDHNIVECARGIITPPQPVIGSRFHRRYYVHASELGYDLQSLAALLRYDQVETIFRALGVLNLAWPLLVWGVIRRRMEYLQRKGLGLLLLHTALSLFFWWMLIFQKGFVLIRASSHGMMLALLIIAAHVVHDAPRSVRWTILVSHALLNTVLWVFLVPTDLAREHLHLQSWPCAAPSLGAAIAVVGILFYCTREFEWLPDCCTAGSAAAWFRVVVGAAFLVLLAAAASVALYRHRLVETIPDEVEETRPAEEGPAADSDRRTLSIRCTGAGRPEMLWDGIANDAANYSMLPFQYPLMIRFPKPLLLERLRLHLYDFDGRVYLFTVEGKTKDHGWIMLNDSSKEPAGGLVEIPVANQSLVALRVTGLYNSSMVHNPANRLLHIKELELVAADGPLVVSISAGSPG